MLHCPDDKLIYKKSDIWDSIRFDRKQFYTNNLKGFVSYCRKQAAKYGIKGSRIASARKVLHFLKTMIWKYGKTRKMEYVWDKLPIYEHIHFVKGNKEEEFYQVCGKKLQKTSKITYCINILKNFIDSYGHRALLAENNEGVDWKAISHAMRYGLQIKELYETNDIIFPLEHANFLKEIKQGKFHYINEIAPILENLMDELEFLSEKTDLPNKPNYKFWETYLYQIHEDIIYLT